ncbi:Dolichyl-diphosphooligosaccharide--protein glycosyltransferase subunit OST6 [Candida viswanathii]|uniref:Dolichyl-diphosphooligosaccharide--protein glycosyltransferase subunit OST6 n=1 Tax=Candida viswanathii TaxID=5486 RepID=A0A367XWE6_9ASCO|nr:Dolichyl-diphosphooligosaccharide--protein glycosyltransferase subunit OST6 [Candida viswanathii]
MQLFDLVIGWLLFLPFSICASPSAVKLTELAKGSENYIIDIYGSDIDILDGPRDYYTVLIFTSSNPEHGCKQCENVHNFVSLVSNSWFTDYLDSHLLTFIKIDLRDPKNAKLFSLIGIQTVPHVWLIAPNPAADFGNPAKIFEDAHLEFKVPQVAADQQALEFAKFLTAQLQRSILIRDQNPLAKFAKTFLLTFSAIVIIRKKGPSKITATRKKTIVSLLAVAVILLFTCGYQYTIQNSVPFMAKNDNGDLVVISGGQHYQFGIETFLVAGNYALLAASLLLLTYIGSYKVGEKTAITSEQVKILLVLVNAVVLYLLYSCLTSIVLRKDHNYPYPYTKLF